MRTDLDMNQLLLAEVMSGISEKGFYAGWMQDLEYDLWRIINGGETLYGHHDVTQAEIGALWSMVRQCGCWIVFDNDTEETAIALDTWKEMFTKRETIR